MGNSLHGRPHKEGSLTDVSPESIHRNKSVSSGGGGDQSSAECVMAESTPESLPLPLTQRQVELLEETWKELEENIARVGVIMYIGLFETHPDVQEVFMPFQGIELEELKHSKQLRSHALRVMAFVQKAVARLHEPQKLEVLLRELGRKHYGYSAKQKYIDLIGPQFIQAIKPSLEDKWTQELHDAWSGLFQYMSTVMKAEMDFEERKATGNTKSPVSRSRHHAVHRKGGGGGRRASSDAAGGQCALSSLRRGTLH